MSIQNVRTMVLSFPVEHLHYICAFVHLVTFCIIALVRRICKCMLYVAHAQLFEIGALAS